jgi:hypothetical protein
MGPDALHVAHAALERSEVAIRAVHEVQGDVGGLTAEVSRLRSTVQQMSDRVLGLEHLVREGFRKLGAGVVQAKRAAQRSHSDVEELREDVDDTKTTFLRGELEALRARDKAIFTWTWKVLGIVVGGLMLAYLTIKFGLIH